MKLIYKILTIALWCVISMGCDKLFEYHYTSYVYSYAIPDTMILIPDTNGFAVMFQGRDAILRETNPDVYDSLGMKHNDMAYNYDYSFPAPPPNWYLSVDFKSIIITSDKDFDTNHAAGTSLNDIIQFIAYSPYPFIQRGYRGTERTKIDKKLSDCTWEDFLLTQAQKYDYLMNQVLIGCLYFTSLPQGIQQHTITVTILDDAGKTWEATIDMNWSN